MYLLGWMEEVDCGGDVGYCFVGCVDVEGLCLFGCLGLGEL